jgi:electron transport complex protein RnfG
MVLVLGGISLVASAGVGYVYRITKAPIEAAAEANKKAALGEVLPAFDATAPTELTLDEIPVVVYTATQGGQTVGYAVETATRQGFSGEFSLMVGFTPEGKVFGVKVLEHAETPGLGDKMTKPGNPLFASFEGRNPSEMTLAVKKDGGDVDALTAATITSKAYVDAVSRAFNAMLKTTGGAVGGTAAGTASGATTKAGQGTDMQTNGEQTDKNADTQKGGGNE